MFLFWASCTTRSDETNHRDIDSIDYIAHHDHNSLDSATIVHDAFLVVLENLYKLSDTHSSRALKQADSILFNCDTNYRRTKHSINNNLMRDLHFFKGEVLFKKGEYSDALREFSFDTIVDYNLGRAACLLKLKRESEAFQNIQEHTGFCYDDFVLGNYYEIVGKPDSALTVYKRAINKDMTKRTLIYDSIATRINELGANKKSKRLSLYIPTRRPSRPEFYDCNN